MVSTILKIVPQIKLETLVKNGHAISIFIMVGLILIGPMLILSTVQVKIRSVPDELAFNL